MNRVTTQRRGLVAVVLVLALAGPAWAGGNWNDDGIAWRSFDEGMAEAKREGKPVCLVVYTDTCPHCRNYARVFHDPEVEELSRKFVMVRLNQHERRWITDDYGPDGFYIPRTMFLSPAGEIAATIQAPRPDYVYFYDEHDPGQLREAMKAAHQKLGSGAAGS